MATKQKVSVSSFAPKRTKVSRPGVHAKTKNSSTKHNKNYAKAYRGQGYTSFCFLYNFLIIFLQKASREMVGFLLFCS